MRPGIRVLQRGMIYALARLALIARLSPVVARFRGTFRFLTDHFVELSFLFLFLSGTIVFFFFFCFSPRGSEEIKNESLTG